MKQEQKQTLTTRVISTTFVVTAIAVFKPFGLGAWDGLTYIHFAALWLIGIFDCTITELILKYIIRKPRSFDKGASYIIHRNLIFQLINTPLVALTLCLYRHHVISKFIPGNQFSAANFVETLAIIAFCSFAIGLYWRFKFRSRYLAAELEETRQLNKQLRKIQKKKSPNSLILEGTTNESVSISISDLLYIEAVGNYLKVCQLTNKEIRTDMIRATMKQIEDKLQPYPVIVRCHRAFMVNLSQVEQISANSRAMQLIMRYNHDAIPVSRSNMAQIKEAINAIG